MRVDLFDFELPDDLIAQRAIAVDSELVELSEPTVHGTPASGPRHLVISADGRNAYLLTEFTAEATRFERLEGGRLERMVAAIVETGYLNGETIRLDGALRMPPK